MAELDETSSEEKRRRILEAAFAVCQERGVHAARMEQVAALAQVSKGTLYRFFDSKEDLFLATIIDSYAQARGASAPGSGDRDQLGPGEAMRARMTGLARALEVVTPRSRVYFQAWGVVADSPEAAKRLDAFLTGFHRDRQIEYEAWIREGQAKGEFRGDADVSTVAHMLVALTGGFIYEAAFDPANATPGALQACFDVILRDLLGYAGPARPTEVEAGG